MEGFVEVLSPKILDLIPGDAKIERQRVSRLRRDLSGRMGTCSSTTSQIAGPSAYASCRKGPK